MSTLRKIPYLISEGLSNLWSNRLMSLSSIGVLTVCLLLISNAVLISSNINAMVSKIGNEDAIVIYLNDGTTEKEAEAFGAKLLNLSNIESVKMISSEEALNNWKEILADYPDLLAGIEPDFLPPSYSLSLNELELIDETVYQLEQMSEISIIREMTDLTNRLIGIKKAVSLTLSVIVIVLFAVSLFIIANTVKLAMFSRRKEISIMKLVGGTDWFIRIPFIVEGLFIGILAGILSFLLQWYLYDFFISQIVSSLNFISAIPFSSFCTSLCVALIAAGGVTGMIGSATSISQYLKV